MPWLPNVPTVASATFTVVDGAGAGGQSFAVQFNPASLDLTISNEFDDRNGNNGARQFVKKSSAKLTMALIFDTTETGTSVRDVTANLAGLLEPAKDGTKKFAPKVEFGWGTYSFKGVIEQFKETIDFFSADGVPLRSSINLTLASQEVEFQSTRNPAPAADRNAPPEPVRAAPGAGAADLANALGDPRAARAIAGLNAAASLRFGAGASLDVGGSVSLSTAADFSAGAGAGLSIGGGAGLSIGDGVAVSAGAGIVATSGAAFGGLRASPSTATISAVHARAALLPAAGLAGAASFSAGGRAAAQAGGSLSADVGIGASLGARVSFGD